MDSTFTLYAGHLDSAPQQTEKLQPRRLARENRTSPTAKTLPCHKPSAEGAFLDEIALDISSLAFQNRPYHFSCAQAFVSRVSAATLVSQRYHARGYGKQCGQALLDPTQPAQMTFIATRRSQVVGTVSTRLDGGPPLNCEALYPDIVTVKRAAGQRLAEFGQLAIDNSSQPLEILGPLFHLTVMFAQKRNAATHAMIEVNPRHVAFYRRVFGFTVAGEQRHCLRVNAPAILMELDLNKAKEQIAQQGGQRRGRISVFPYCFTLAESKVMEKSLLGITQ